MVPTAYKWRHLENDDFQLLKRCASICLSYFVIILKKVIESLDCLICNHS